MEKYALVLEQEAAGTPGSSRGASGVTWGTTCPGLCLCSHLPTSVKQLLLGCCCLSQALCSGCLPCLFSSLWVQLFCICKAEWVVRSFCTLCSFSGFGLVCVLNAGSASQKEHYSHWMASSIQIPGLDFTPENLMRYKQTSSFLHLVRGSHDVFSRKSLFKDLRIYKQVDTSSGFFYQAVRIFPGHTALCFSLVIPSFGWQQRNELTGSSIWGRDLLWGDKHSALRKTLLYFQQGWISDPATEQGWLLSKGIHIAKIYKMLKRTGPWDCPLWMGRCAWLFSKGYGLGSNLKR